MLKKIPSEVRFLMTCGIIVGIIIFIITPRYEEESHSEIKVEKIPTNTKDLNVYLLNDSKTDQEYIVIQNDDDGLVVLSREEFNLIYGGKIE